jgi:hypothetical protein
MAFDFGNVGDLLNYGPVPQSTEKVTDLSPHLDGGNASASGTNAGATDSDKMVLHTAIAIVLTALVLLWALGGLVFTSARL